MRRKILACLTTFAAMLPVQTSAQDHTPKFNSSEKKAVAFTVDQAMNFMEVKGVADPLDPVIWVNSRAFLKPNFRPADKYFRAVIDKASGQVAYQIYLETAFAASARFSSMSFMADGKLHRAPIERVSFDVSCSRYSCTHYEHFVVKMEREELNALVAAGGQSWRGKLFGDTTEGTDTEFLVSELQAFLAVVDRQVANLSPAEPAATEEPVDPAPQP